MESFLHWTVWVHASLGTICLISGVLALLFSKKPGRHPKAGKVFAISLMLVVLAILPNMIAKTNIFLLGLGGLAVYTAVEGWRALKRYKGQLAPHPTALDYGINGLEGLLSLWLIGFGAMAFKNTGNILGLVCVGFGVLGILLINGARKRWKHPPTAKEWLALHISMMTGGFGAALTAFVAVQFSGKVGGYEWIIWIAPSIVMSLYGSREIRNRGLVQS